MKKFSNMSDLAAHLHLSRSTVSYILNNKWRERNISPKTAERVRKFASEVDFLPNFLGLAINGKAVIDVAILLPQNIYEHHQEAFFSFLSMLSRRNLKFLVFQLGSEEDNRLTLARMHDFRVARALLFAPMTLISLEQIAWWKKMTAAASDLEFLFYDCRFPERSPEQWPDNVYCCGFKLAPAVRSIVEFIARQGYKSLHSFFHIDPQTVKQTAERHHLKYYPFSVSINSEAIITYLLMQPRPSRPEAVLIPDDTIAGAVIAGLMEKKFRVPEDYAFLSWDGLPVSCYFKRTLTTLEIPHNEMLAFAERFVAGDSLPHIHQVTPHLRIGESMPAAYSKF